MRTKIIFLLVCFLATGGIFFAQNNKKTMSISENYTSLWDKVEQSEKASLPQSALETVDVIYQKAVKEKNSPELLKTLIYKMKFELAIDNNKSPELIADVEKYTSQSTDIVEQSVLHSILANLYFQYYQSDLYTINSRTAMTGYVPEDMQEWSGNIFISKIADHINQSVKAEKDLQLVSAEKYKEILTSGESSRNLRPTLYDFLLGQGIDILRDLSGNYSVKSLISQSKIEGKDYFAPASAFIKLSIQLNENDLKANVLKLYQQFISFRMADSNNPQAFLVADLDRIEFVYNHSEDEARGEYYMDALSNLENQYRDKDFSVEILYRQAQYYRNNNRQPVVPLNKRVPAPDSETSVDGIKKAYEICKKGIGQFPNYERIGLLKNLLSGMTNSYASIQAGQTVYPGKDLELNVNYRNLNSLTIEIYKIQAPVETYNSWDKKGLYKEKGKLIETKVIQLLNSVEYVSQDTMIKVPVKELGCYEYVVYSDKGKDQISNQQFSVSKLASLSRTYSGNNEILVVDRVSGKPVEGASINFYKQENNQNTLVSTSKTDKNGLALSISAKDVNWYNVSLGDDNALILSSMPWAGDYDRPDSGMNQLNLFTDRGIYRPGQTVYLKGIAYKIENKKGIVLSNQSYTLILRDANYQEVSKKTFKTNEFGSFSGEFVLPQNVLNGSFSITTDNASCNFRVEEYKRPTFEIKFNPIDKTYGLGDQVGVNGTVKTYSGINLQETNVKYRVMQYPHWLLRWVGGTPVQVSEGFVRTNDQGEFDIHFPAEKRPGDNQPDYLFYNYVVEASVTDTNGETQESSTSVVIGNRSMYLTIEQSGTTSRNVDKNEGLQVIVKASNLNNKDISCKGKYEIYSLTGKQSLEKEADLSDWKTEKLMLSGDFVSQEKLDIPGISKMPSGAYRIIVKANDDKNREITAESDFIFYSKKDKQPPLLTYEWLLTPKVICKVGEKAEIIYGSSAKDVDVLYEIFKGDKKLEVKRFQLNNESRKIEIPFNESYGDGIVVALTFIKDEKVFHRDVNVLLEQPDQELNVTLETFRDRLLPGQKEEWKILVKDNKNKLPALAEVLAGMYDASLDKLASLDWYFRPSFDAYLWSPYLSQDNGFNSSYGRINIQTDYVNVPGFSYDSFNWFGMNMYSQEPVLMIRGASSSNEISAGWGQTNVRRSMRNKSIAFDEAPAPAMTGSIELASQEVRDESGTGEQPVSIRKNFNETAFFYPQLRTNENGETVISFTVPESNTTWKLMALAHTKDLKYGKVTAEAISQKKLMVTPNLPRFLRHGDMVSIATNISNLSEKDMSGKVSLELLDPSTEKTILVVPGNTKDFSLQAGKTTSVEWTFNVPSGIDLTTCKIVAKTNDFSDGEQHILPVIPNRMLVTESLPLAINGPGSKDFSLNKLMNQTSKTAENYRLTLEFADNPAWYAVQALPAMTTPVSENTVSWFAAYYANTVAASIVNNNPKIKQVMNTWVQQGGTKETLISNLEKNQELKAVLLEETPWVMEAKNEAEQKQRLSLLFDLNRSENLSSTALSKLKELQTSSGGWSWYSSMYPNVSLTQWILYGMHELIGLSAIQYGEEEKMMQIKALAYIDHIFKEDFENFKKSNKNWEKTESIPIHQLEYLLVRNYYRDIPLTESREAVKFYTNVAEKYWTKNNDVYSRAITAILMKNDGRTQVANNILKSLREHASCSNDMGMYWANNKSSAFRFQSATTIHTFIMQAFEEMNAPEKEMDEMKLWLLKQKQTQEWESTPATVNAVYILLKTGTNWLENSGNVSLSLGSDKIDMSGKEAGTGYIKKTYEAASITPAMGKVSVSKQDNGPAWGALYWQYYEDLDKITDSKTGLNVEKKLFIEKTTSTGKTLEAIGPNNPLKTGDKVIVRLTVRNDRDMEYVMLKDMRGACFEPADQISMTKWKERVAYYQTTKDASTNFYFDNLPKGTYVFEYPLYVARVGEYSNGMTTIQCMYAPEFVSHTAGEKVVVK